MKVDYDEREFSKDFTEFIATLKEVSFVLNFSPVITIEEQYLFYRRHYCGY